MISESACARKSTLLPEVIERNRENLIARKFFTRIIFNAKISRSTVLPPSMLNVQAYTDSAGSLILSSQLMVML